MCVWADMIDWHFIQAAGLKCVWPWGCFTSLSRLLCLIYIWIHWFGSHYLAESRFCHPLACLLPAQGSLLSLPILILPWFCNQAVLAEPDKWRGVWVGGSWDTYVVVLFWYYLRSPHFSWAPAACLSSFCVIWFRGCICSCPPSGTVRGRGSQRQFCLPDHWLCREAQQCQKRIAVCCHHADVI